MLVAARIGLALAAVGLPGVPRAAGPGAVEVGGQAVVGPAAVDASLAGDAVGDGERQVGLAQDLEKSLLQVAERHRDLAAQDGAELAGARGVWSEDGLDVRGRRLVLDAGLVAGSGLAQRHLGITVTGLAPRRMLRAALRPDRARCRTAWP